LLASLWIKCVRITLLWKIGDQFDYFLPAISPFVWRSYLLVFSVSLSLSLSPPPRYVFECICAHVHVVYLTYTCIYF
jgi:hypothetical protein